MSQLAEAAAHALQRLPEPGQTLLRRAVRRVNRSLPGRRVRWGNIAHHAPFSTHYGWDRGLPVDRHYIEAFLAAHGERIRGSVLEVKSALYASRFGRPERITVLDIDLNNRHADLVCDLNEPGSLPQAAFDCVILTQVLQYTDPLPALRNLGRSLRRGGCALITVPSLSPIDLTSPHSDRWRWTPRGLEDAIRAAGLTCTVDGRGNALAAAAFMLGLAAEEIPDQLVNRNDHRFPIIACGIVEPAPADAEDPRPGRPEVAS